MDENYCSDCGSLILGKNSQCCCREEVNNLLEWRKVLEKEKQLMKEKNGYSF